MSSQLEVWAGVECTVNRVGDQFHDQLQRSGHDVRLSDLERIATLGIRAVRYPVLWERTAPEGLERADWRWLDERLGRLRDLGIRVIAGLVHHGSGPRATRLDDPRFPELCAQYAQAVATRYPWLDAYTPVNEPLTTARFSGLYGHWFPHGNDARMFFRTLLGECRAIVLSMRAIRRVNPKAILVQSEDLGRIYSSPLLSYQADFENERRWLSFDLLCGRVDRHHPMWRFALSSGVTERELGFFLETPCPPDIFGLNHYLTSDRYLDERLEDYPEWAHGGNGRHRYADVEAVRARLEGPSGFQALMRETWNRYRRPIALTEVHLGGRREDQLRWLRAGWEDCQRARAEGIDVRAMTAWAIFGSHDWNCLVTRENGYYESGLFDVRGPVPRETAVARLVRALATDREFDLPVLEDPGWWQRATRLIYGPTACAAPDDVQEADAPPGQLAPGHVDPTTVSPAAGAGAARGELVQPPSPELLLARLSDEDGPSATVSPDPLGTSEAADASTSPVRLLDPTSASVEVSLDARPARLEGDALRGGDGTIVNPGASIVENVTLNDLFGLSVSRAAAASRLGGVAATKVSGARKSRPLLVTGATGTLGRAFARICESRGLRCVALSRRELDIADEAAVDAALRQVDPWAVINSAGFVRVDAAEREVQRCLRENAIGPGILAARCAARDVRFLTFSSDLVFDGSLGTPHVERHPVSPLNVYGRSKAEAEARVLESFPEALVVRTSAFFGPWDEANFLTSALRRIASGQSVLAPTDVTVSPTYVPDLVHACLDLMLDRAAGLWHLANPGAVSWADFARLGASAAGMNAALVTSCPLSDLGLAAQRPFYSVLGTEKGVMMPSLEDAVDRYFRERIPS